MKLEIFYRDEEVKEMYDEVFKEVGGHEKSMGRMTAGSVGHDIVLPEDLKFEHFGDCQTIDLGIIIKPNPVASFDGLTSKKYHFLMSPRSSLFKKTGLMLVNSFGLSDHDFCGPKDFWQATFIYMQKYPIFIPAGTRILQIFFMETVFPSRFVASTGRPDGNSRGGVGSTGS